MEKLKSILKSIPNIVWIVGIILLVLVIYWKSNDISDWVEHRKQAIFLAHDAEKIKEIEELHKKIDNEIKLKLEAQAREQIKAQEADTLRNLIDARGGKIEEEQKKIDEARKKFTEDTALIEAAGRGEISMLQLCQKQCDDSALIGYPCRQNYCNKYK